MLNNTFTPDTSNYQSHFTGQPLFRRKLIVIAIVSAFSGVGQPVLADEITWNGGTGNWNDSAQWSGGVTPAAGSNVNIDGGKTGIDSTVSLNINAAVNDLTIDTGDRIKVNTGRTLTLLGDLDNDGTISLNATTSTATPQFSSRLQIEGGTTLTGSGVLTTTNNAYNQIFGSVATDVLTNAAGHTIQGSGQLGNDFMGLNNQGLIDANQSVAMVIDLTNTDGVTRVNTGTLQASNGGRLTISDTALNNAGGLIQALDNSTIEINSTSRISGGTIDVASNGLLQLHGDATLAAETFTNRGEVRINYSGRGRIAGTVTNDGTISLNATTSTATPQFSSRLQIEGGTTLIGSGVLTTTNNAYNQIFGSVATDVLTNAAGHTIQGSGQLGNDFMGLNNQGLIDANQSVAMVIDPNNTLTVQNTGTLRGSGSGGLQLTGGSFDNQGTVDALNGSGVTYTTSATTLNNSSGTLTGGIWRAESSGDGAMLTVNGGEIVNNAAEIVLSGDGSVFRARQPANSNSLVQLETSLQQNTENGTLRVLDNRNYTTLNTFVNNGMLELGGGTFSAANLSNNANSELFGHGSVAISNVNSSIDNSGVIAVGNDSAIGQLTFDFADGGVFRQSNQGILDFSLEKLTSFDSLSIVGSNSSLILDGTLRISSFDGYNPNIDDLFTIMTFNTGSLNGIFDNIVAVGFDPLIRFHAEYFSDSVVIRTSVVPLPTSAWLMLSALGFLAARRLREDRVS